MEKEKTQNSEQNSKTKTVRRDFKARVFEMIYRDKKELLELYNDVSFIIDSRLSLYEHQSTYSPNLPLQYLMYVSDLYSKITKDANLYGSKKVQIPPPKFLIFYNGVEKRPEIEEMRLSDAYIIEDPEPSLELKAVMLNINPGNNVSLLNTCKTLSDYVAYTSRVRVYAETMPVQEAVERAIAECIKEDILAEFLTKFRAEAKAMSIYEYDEERQRRFDREEGKEEGREEGREEGKEEGEQRLASLMQILLENDKKEEIHKILSNKDYRKELYRKYNL